MMRKYTIKFAYLKYYLHLCTRFTQSLTGIFVARVYCDFINILKAIIKWT